MLKNNKEREQYFNNETNWATVKLFFIAERSGEICVKRLMQYPIIRIEAYIDLYQPKMCVLGYYQLSSDGISLHDIYNKTVNQCINIMRESDHE